MRSSEIVTLAICVATSLFIGLTSFMSPDIYRSWWWICFWGLIAIGLCVTIIRNHMWRWPLTLSLHVALLFMITGGGVTALTSLRGSVHLTPGTPQSYMLTEQGDSIGLPFSICLDRFVTEYYKGMNFPRNYHSYLTTSEGDSLHVSVNYIAEVKGWRIYQTSFDRNGGSILTVSHDPMGIFLTYAGYILFAVSGLLMLLRRLLPRWCPAASRLFACVTVLLMAVTVNAAPAVSSDVAKSLEGRLVVFQGDTVTFANMASRLTFKLTGKERVSELTPTRFVASVIMYPDEWSHVPFIKVKGRALREKLRCSDDYLAVSSLYDSDNSYIPQTLYQDGTGPLDSEIIKLDEKVSILAGLWDGTLFTPLETGIDRENYDWQIKSELLYVKYQPKKWYFMLMFALSLICFISVSIRRTSVLRLIPPAAFVIGICVFVWDWSIVGYIPLADAGEIMFFVSVILPGICSAICRRSPLVAGFGMLMGAFAALVAWISVKDPSVTPLMPVLHSPWLSVHVAFVMTSYAFLALTLPLSIIAIVRKSQRGRLQLLSQRITEAGVYLLGLGIFAGAMWANVSWGRYWAWDPKETWALVTMLLYAIPLHRSIGLRKSPVLYFSYLIFSFLSIAMTYWGVNYLPSMHAYQ